MRQWGFCPGHSQRCHTWPWGGSELRWKANNVTSWAESAELSSSLQLFYFSSLFLLRRKRTESASVHKRRWQLGKPELCGSWETGQELWKTTIPSTHAEVPADLSLGKQCLSYKTESRWGCSCGLAAAYHFATLAKLGFSDYPQKSQLPVCPQKTVPNLEQQSAVVIYGCVRQSL